MSTQKLYIGNLPYRTTEGDVREYFRHYGPIYSVILIYDPETRQTRGYGFIEMEYFAAESALRDLNDTWFMGRNLKIRRAAGKEAAMGNKKESQQMCAANLTTPMPSKNISEDFGRGDTDICGINGGNLIGSLGEYGDFKHDDSKGFRINGKYYQIKRRDYGLYHAYKFTGNRMEYLGPNGINRVTE